MRSKHVHYGLHIVPSRSGWTMGMRMINRGKANSTLQLEDVAEGRKGLVAYLARHLEQSPAVLGSLGMCRDPITCTLLPKRPLMRPKSVSLPCKPAVRSFPADGRVVWLQPPTGPRA
jgi:hypothetical protein